MPHIFIFEYYSIVSISEYYSIVSTSFATPTDRDVSSSIDSARVSPVGGKTTREQEDFDVNEVPVR